MSSAEGDKRRLRIALLVDRFGRRYGGAEAYGVELFRALSKHHDVTVMAHEFDHDLPVKEIRIRGSRRWPSWLRVCHFAWRARALTRAGYDIVHSHMNAGLGDVHVAHVVPFQYRKLIGKPWYRRLLKWLDPSTAAYLLLERASFSSKGGRQLVAVSPLIRQQMLECGVRESQLTVIPPGVHLHRRDPDVRRQIRRQLGWGDEVIGCLMVARNPLRKGLQSLADALPLLDSNIRLLVVGAEQNVKQRLVKLSPEIAQRLVLIGPTTDVSPYYLAADVFVHPTLNDSFGMSPLEAMAHGLPVVMSDRRYCGFAEYCSDQEHAILLSDPQHVHSLADAIGRVASDASLRERLIANGNVLAASMSWEQVARQFEARYDRVMQYKS